MRSIILASVVAAGFGILGATPSLAAPANATPLTQAAGDVTGMQQIWYDRYGRWHPNRPVYRPAYRRPACRSVRVCGPYGCTWRRRCY
jgi:hypothetical protein